MPDALHIRRAEEGDAATLTRFNVAMARETEGKVLAPAVAEAGTRALLRAPQHGFYLVAERDDTVTGALMITTEWSDWRNGLFWWIQSVYVRPEERRQGVFSALYAHVKRLAAEASNVCGLRLYVDRENLPARRTYGALGMQETSYRLYEELLEG